MGKTTHMMRFHFNTRRIFRLLTLPIMIAGLLSTAFIAQAESTTKVARYLAIQNQALPGQMNLLDQTFQVHFSRDVCTIGDAMRYLLRFSGYRLVNAAVLSKATQAVLLQPLPETDRKLGPMRLQAGLLTLVGQPFGLVIDPVHRLIGLRLKPAFQSIYEEE
jgi:conjugative transfer region protein (TIGR03748 family)